MSFDIKKYRALVFDCDGVILNSNKVKTEAFYRAALPFGEHAAKSLVEYHVANGGISRYKKFNYFLERIIGQGSEEQLNKLLESYANYVKVGLLSCEIASGLEDLRTKTPESKWFIVSGGDQNELREVFSTRGISKYFDGGVFGSPDAKEFILAREIGTQNISLPGLFLGDSKYDYVAAQSAQLDFVFLSAWSEVVDWEQWVGNHNIKTLQSVAEI